MSTRPAKQRARGAQRFALAFAAVATVLAVGRTPAAAGATPAEVRSAIDRGRAFLFAAQANGNWEVVPARDPADAGGPASVANLQFGGLTGLATFSLLASGTDPAEEHVRAAVQFLRDADIRGTYALAMRCMVWSLLPPQPWLRQAVLADRLALVNAVHVKGVGAGLYSYYAAPGHDDFDHSVSQFGTLGVWGLEQAGAEVPTNYWALVEQGWRRHQFPDGGWAYQIPPGDTEEKLSMTAAGLATLYLTQEFTRSGVQCGGNVTDPDVDRGLAWLGAHIAAGQPGDADFYTLFGISRVALASGYKRIGGLDWFQWGGGQIIPTQEVDGSWHRGAGKLVNIASTGFAMLFLARGQAPVMMDKLSYDVVGTDRGPHQVAAPGTWNQRPRDVANLARWMGRQIESPLNWQVVRLDSPDDLHDAPILYMAGAQAPRLSPADRDRLRRYVEDGGLVLGHADCSSTAFAAGFRKLGEELFPGRSFRALPAAHVIYTGENFPRSRWSTKPTVEGLTNGARELMLLLPAGDPAKVWQTQSFPSVARDPWGQLMIDVFLYAVDQQGLRHRGDTYLIDRRADLPAMRTVTVARLRHDGNWDPEPGGWRRLANAMHNDRATDVDLRVVDPSPGTLDKAVRLASLTVCGGVKLTAPQRDAIRVYVRAGGTLLVDAAGGRSVDGSAAAAEIAVLFPDAPKELPVLPPSDPVYAAGVRLASVDYRRFDATRRRSHEPRLRGFRAGAGFVYCSLEDVSVGLVGEPVDGIAGYAPADALHLAENILTAVSGGGPMAEPVPDVGQWHPAQMATDLHPISWDATRAFTRPGRYRVTFQYTSGAHLLQVRSVVLATADGTEVARDNHDGSTGLSNRDNAYLLAVPAITPGTPYKLTISARSDGGTDSNGTVTAALQP
jgi:hypothetical protein